MDSLIQIFSSVNLVTLVAFFLTLVFIVIEFRLVVKGKTQKNVPNIPQFDPTTPTGFGPQAQNVQADSVKAAEEEKKLRLHKIILPILIVLMIVFGSVTFADIFFGTDESPKGTVAVQEVKSDGIKIYTKEWAEIAGNSNQELKAGDMLHVGIGAVSGSDIDMARIKINESSWSDSQNTSIYDKKLNIYYRDYVIKPSDTALDIEAQLHSRAGGWLND